MIALQFKVNPLSSVEGDIFVFLLGADALQLFQQRFDLLFMIIVMDVVIA